MDTINPADFIRLAHKVCAKLNVKHDPDMVGVAMLALCEFAPQFDASNGAKPTTYLFQCIRGRVLDALKVDRVVYDGTREGRKGFGKVPLTYLDAPMPGSDDDSERAPACEALVTPDASEEIIAHDLAEKSWDVIKRTSLTDSEARVLSGIRAGQTYSEIGTDMGVSKQRVGQIATAAIGALRDSLQEARIL